MFLSNSSIVLPYAPSDSRFMPKTNVCNKNNVREFLLQERKHIVSFYLYICICILNSSEVLLILLSHPFWRTWQPTGRFQLLHSSDGLYFLSKEATRALGWPFRILQHMPHVVSASVRELSLRNIHSRCAQQRPATNKRVLIFCFVRFFCWRCL